MQLNKCNEVIKKSKIVLVFKKINLFYMIKSRRVKKLQKRLCDFFSLFWVFNLRLKLYIYRRAYN